MSLLQNVGGDKVHTPGCQPLTVFLGIDSPAIDLQAGFVGLFNQLLSQCEVQKLGRLLRQDLPEHSHVFIFEGNKQDYARLSLSLGRS